MKKSTQRDSTLSKKVLEKMKVDRTTRRKLVVAQMSHKKVLQKERLVQARAERRYFVSSSTKCSVSVVQARSKMNTAQAASTSKMQIKTSTKTTRQSMLPMKQARSKLKTTPEASRTLIQRKSKVQTTDKVSATAKVPITVAMKGSRMPLSTDRVRKHRQQMGPEGWARKRAADRAYNAKRKELGLTKSIKDLSERDAKKIGKKWRERSQRYRHKKKQMSNTAMEQLVVVTVEEEPQLNLTDGTIQDSPSTILQ